MLIAKAEGATAKEAVERLAKHKEAVRGELNAMKAEANSIKMTSSEMRHHILGIPPQYQKYERQVLCESVGRFTEHSLRKTCPPFILPPV